MTTLSREARPYDVVLFGATGFTGKLVAEYLAGSRPKGLAWALAGRSRDKLEDVRRALAAIDGTLSSLPLLVGDGGDVAFVSQLAGQARVVCTTVGPYAKYGRGLVAACAETGTDYCDLTGEVNFIRDTIDRCDARAASTGARIVPSCGFDSLPSDLGVHLLYEHFASLGDKLGSATLYVEAMKGGASGGTIASMLNLVEEASRDRALRRLLADPYALNPDRDDARGPDGADQMTVKWDAAANRWTAPFVMASVNTRVVRRSNALLDYAYGRDFRYSEVMSFRKGPKGFLQAAGLTAGVGAFIGLASLEATRKLIGKRLPAAGEGPSKSSREQGYFRIRIVGTSAKSNMAKTADSNPVKAVVRVEGQRDPGYGETSRMLGEAALCLAMDDLPRRGGVLTPAVAMGTKLVDRLRRIGMVWSVETL